MQWLIDSPLVLRMAVVFVASAFVATLLNAAIYQWSWEKRLVSPWQRPPKGASPRSWLDFLPVFGWLRLRRDEETLGRGFWVRPCSIEVAFAVAMTTLYWWEVDRLGLIMPQLRDLLGPMAPTLDPAPLAGVVHANFLAHWILAALMTVATFIDFYERIIPDEVTFPGTLVGLLLVTATPWALPPNVVGSVVPIADGVLLADAAGRAIVVNQQPLYVTPTHLAAPNAWPFPPEPRSLAALGIGLGCFWLWAFAIADRRWPRAGRVGKKLCLVSRRVVRDLTSPIMLTTVAAGTLLIAAVWRFDGPRWQGLLSALVGLAASGMLVWAVRLIGTAVLRREAMGFGDVTLMMMIGAFTGWQASPLIFFLAPLAGILLGVANVVTRGDWALPYGPFLCLATAWVIVFWGSFWSWGWLLFGVGWLVPAVLVACMVMLGLLLAMLQGLKMLLGVAAPDEEPHR